MALTAKNNVLLCHLPTEIVEFQILTRLPVKSLLRFKSVCKSWNSLISENQLFMHTRLANFNHHYLLLRRRTSQNLIGCINGLLCFCTEQKFGIKFTISNPATKQLLDIRALPVKSDAKYVVGFGFDSVANDYKVVYIRTMEHRPLVGFMYSSRRWRKIAPSNFCYTASTFFLNSKQPVIVNESLYWLNSQFPGLLTVLSFDIRQQVFRLLPDSFDRECEKYYVLLNIRDSVALMSYDWTLFVGSAVGIYIFNHRCSLWDKIYVGPLIGKEPSFVLGLKFITSLPNNHMIFGGPDLKLYRVNPETHTILSIQSPEKKGDNISYFYDSCTYSQSLIFIQGMETLPFYEDDDKDLFDTDEYLFDTSVIKDHYLKSGLILDCSYTQIQNQVALWC